MYVSQPAISRKVLALEKKLGCPFIDRTSDLGLYRFD
ncbi:LysR family transcriptional regulator [uncultured Eubacterium sp.]